MFSYDYDEGFYQKEAVAQQQLGNSCTG